MRGFLIAAFALLAACASPAPDDGLRTVTIHAIVPENAGQVYLTGNLPELGPWRADGLPMSGTGRERVVTLRVAEGTALEYKVTLGTWDREGLGPSGTVMPNQQLTVHGDTEGTIEVVDWKADVSVYVGDPAGAGVQGELTYWRDVASPLLQETRHVEI